MVQDEIPGNCESLFNPARKKSGWNALSLKATKW